MWSCFGMEVFLSQNSSTDRSSDQSTSDQAKSCRGDHNRRCTFEAEFLHLVGKAECRSVSACHGHTSTRKSKKRRFTKKPRKSDSDAVLKNREQRRQPKEQRYLNAASFKNQPRRIETDAGEKTDQKKEIDPFGWTFDPFRSDCNQPGPPSCRNLGCKTKIPSGEINEEYQYGNGQSTDNRGRNMKTR